VQVRCTEGLANHSGPESCAGIREGDSEALTGERAGQPLRFYGSCQGLREPLRVERGLVGVDRPGGTRDTPCEDDESCCGG
jgi:hypothetical protein